MSWVGDDAEQRDVVGQSLRTQALSIESGSPEIQRNIVSERVICLPLRLTRFEFSLESNPAFVTGPT